MKNDAAEEAALGLLGLHANGADYHRPSPTIPLKRKPSTAFAQPRPLDNNNNNKTSSSSTSSDAIRCICGFDYDDGFSVACDVCGRWVHAACFDIVDGKVPEEFRCWVCDPRPVNREKAVKVQKARLRHIQAQGADVEVEKQRRRASPGVERKGRRTSATVSNSDGNAHTNAKRKRRVSITAAPILHQITEDEHIDIDEPSAHSYVHIDHDDIPHQQTRDRLKRLAQHWRGVTALDGPTSPVYIDPDALPLHPHTALRPIPSSSLSHSTLSLHSNPSIRPPAYSVHTTQPIPSHTLIAPYISTIVPSTHYLSDPLNSYAHLSMPKPFVHLLGPPLDVALDARTTGQETRYVRNGCRPNAVLRPVLCNRNPHSSDDRTSNADLAETLTFGVFALRDLKAQEEVILGWEWDDGSVIHQLPALINSPHLFAPYRFEQFRNQMTSMLHAISSTFTTCACGTRAKDCALSRLAEFVDGQIPPLLPSSFHRDQEGRESNREDERMQVDLGPLVSVERGFRTREREPMSGGMRGVEMVNGYHESLDWMESPGAGPSRLPYSGTRVADPKGKARASEDDIERELLTERRIKSKSPLADLPISSAHDPLRHGRTDQKLPSPQSNTRKRPNPLPLDENSLPPKLRKTWIRRKAKVLKEKYGSSWDENDRTIQDSGGGVLAEEDTRMNIDDPIMTPSAATPSSTNSKPVSASYASTTETPYPTSPFANLSLRSPAFAGPSSYFATQPSKSPEEASETTQDVQVLDEVRAPPLPTVPEAPEGEGEDEPMNIDSSPDVPEHRPVEPNTVEPSIPLETRDMNTTTEASTDGIVDNISISEPITIAADEKPPASPPPVDIDVPMPNGPVEQGTDETSNRAEPEIHPSPFPPPPSSIIISPPIEPPQEIPANVSSLPVGEPITDSLKSPPSAATPSPSPSQAALPHPPQKVKLSLKDFALRKKKKREEEESRPPPPPPPLPPPPVESQMESTSEPGSAPTGLAPSSTSPPTEQKSVSGTNGDEVQKASTSVTPSAHSYEPQLSDVKRSSEGQVMNVDALSSHEQSSEEQSNLSPGAAFNGSEAHAVEMGSTSRGPPRKASLLNGTSTIDYRSIVSYQAKVELTDVFSDVLPGSKNHSRSPQDVSTSTTYVPDHVVQQSSPAPSMPPPIATVPLARQPSQQSQEDGEILSPPPPKPPPLAARPHTPPPAQPPTQPRSFHTPSGSVSPKGGPPSSAPPRRPALPPSYRAPYSHSSSSSSRPLPSAPRALRTAGLSNHHTSTYSPPSRSSYSSSSHSVLPRGPSADRDRDRDWDRDRLFGRGRGRGSQGWSR
ncbi:unnamed protein product [Somion occarium]|uniref:PHD-type domain-containing protein n=1 Tax=Somion occarium TaxID=3059160 RepID=A0ABP1CVF5_9APHY